jgi:hypothetical protein
MRRASASLGKKTSIRGRSASARGSASQSSCQPASSEMPHPGQADSERHPAPVPAQRAKQFRCRAQVRRARQMNMPRPCKQSGSDGFRQGFAEAPVRPGKSQIRSVLGTADGNRKCRRLRRIEDQIIRRHAALAHSLRDPLAVVFTQDTKHRNARPQSRQTACRDSRPTHLAPEFPSEGLLPWLRPEVEAAQDEVDKQLPGHNHLRAQGVAPAVSKGHSPVRRARHRYARMPNVSRTNPVRI